MELLAKMKCGSTQDFGNKNVEVNLTAAQGDSEENKTFSIYTPRAEAKLHITNPNAIGFFEAGEEYLLTFTKVVVPLEERQYSEGQGRQVMYGYLALDIPDDALHTLNSLKKGEVFYPLAGNSRLIQRVK